jgi:hypothetical protein
MYSLDLPLVLGYLAQTLVGLVAIWAGLGRPHWFIRVIIVGGLLALGLPIPAYDLMALFFVQSVVVILPLMIWRSFTNATAGADGRQRSMWRRLLPQFHLRDLLLFMVVVAAIAAFFARVPSSVWTSWAPYYGLILDSRYLSYWWIFYSFDSYPLWMVFVATGVLLGLSTLIGAMVALWRRCAWLRVIAAIMVPTCWLIVLWLRLMRHAHDRGCGDSNCGVKPGASLEHVRLTTSWAARAGLLVMALLILLPLAIIYGFVLHPLTIAEASVPDPNGYPELLKAAEEVNNPSLIFELGELENSPVAEQEAILDRHKDVLASARSAMAKPCLCPLDYSNSVVADDSIDKEWGIQSISMLFHTEGDMAKLNGRCDEALAIYADMLRLGQAYAAGALMAPYTTAQIIQSDGIDALRQLRRQLNVAQCRGLIEELEAHTYALEPIEQVLRRQDAWGERVFGWPCRLANLPWRLGWRTPGIGAAEEIDHRLETTRRLLIIGLALECYCRDNGRLPDKLAELVPAYLRALPNDLFTDRPFHYWIKDSEYILYSEGPDRDDDGGIDWSQRSPFDSDLLLDPPGRPAPSEASG